MSEPIKTKKCCHCKQILPVSEFHKDRSQHDGFCPCCRFCHKQIQKRYRRSEKGKQNNILYQRRYRITEKGKQLCSQSYKRYCTRNPEKIKAKHKVNNAIRDGKMLPACHYWCFCGKQAEQYHHPSYTPEHQLDVIPICRLCHIKLHREVLPS